jgi:hypothetical protein
MTYVIKLTELHGITRIFTTKKTFATATNCAVKFETPKQAATYIAAQPCLQCFDQCKSLFLYVEGPKGGWYSAKTGNRLQNIPF